MSRVPMVVLDDSDEDENNRETNVSQTNSEPTTRESRKVKKRKCDYELVEEDPKMEDEINFVKRISELTPLQIEYMVIRDVNYFLDIFSGECEHSWRHQEFKKFSKRSGDFLYENSRLSAYTFEQYSAAVRGLQFIFCKKDFNYNEYIVKVLLPEALVKICMRVYQCSKDAAEEFLKVQYDKNSNTYPKGSALYSPPSSTREQRNSQIEKSSKKPPPNSNLSAKQNHNYDSVIFID